MGNCNFIKGMDISSLEEVEKLGGVFFDHGKQEDVLHILKSYGGNYVRLRLWNNPYSADGAAYGAGNNDVDVTIRLAKRALQKDMGFLLDFHYSDFWTDPGKQFIPKAWEGFSDEELVQAVYEFTKETLLKLKAHDATPTMVQIGNEITNGLLWPNGKKPNYKNIAAFVSAGIQASREVIPEIPIMIHLDNGGNNEMYRDWFDHYFQYGEDFDIIGLSYYPFWHGTLASLEFNMKDIVKRYQKDLIIAEVSMGHTMEDYASYEKLPEDKRKGMATKPKLAAKIEHSMTHEGQCKFIQDFLRIIKGIPDDRCKGFFYWEPAWLPVPGSEWATKEAIAYMKEKEGGGNEWANQALFDYDGNALPALEVIKNL